MIASGAVREAYVEYHAAKVGVICSQKEIERKEKELEEARSSYLAAKERLARASERVNDLAKQEAEQ